MKMFRTKGKQALTIILSLLLLFTMIPSSLPGGFAYAADVVASGSCGDNLTWTLDSEGLLTISGEGRMKYWISSGDVPWASYRDEIKTVVIDSGVTSIGHHAFTNCSSLESITVPDGVTTIGESAFSRCSSLTSITIPESVTSIGDYAFYGCSSFTSITIPEGVTSIGDDTFDGCSSLTSITIPESVTSIGEYAFNKCSSLTSITIPESVTSIEDFTFSKCSSLTSIMIPEGVTSIGLNAFKDCSSLTSINIPDVVTYIGDSAFENCTSLKNISFPEGITEISYSVLLGSGITSFIVPESVTTIRDNAFNALKDLEYILIPPGVTNMVGTDIFNSNNITPDSAVIYVVKDSYADTNITNDQSLHPALKYVTKDGEHYWYEEITTEPACETTGTKTITCVKCGETRIEEITALGHDFVDGVCSRCGEKDLSDWEYTISNDKVTITKYLGSDTDVVIPSTIKGYSVTSIGNYAFQDCSSLISITIPEGVTSIGGFAFSNCSSLTSIAIPKGVTGIGGNAFINCSSLTSVTIPDSVAAIGNAAFTNCSSLTSITIPDSVTNIGSSAFKGCSSLINIKLPEGVTTILEYTFDNCSSLTSINIPESVTYIGFRAFNNCSSLTSILLSENISSIQGYLVFDGCDHLTTAYVVQDSYADNWLTESNHSSLAKYVTKDGEHYWYEETTIEPRCETIGTKTITCVKCGEKRTEEIAALGHDFVDGVCSRCGAREYIASGTCGDNLTWALDDEGLLTISGIGEMQNYGLNDDRAPWFNYRNQIVSVTITGNITRIGNSSFNMCSNIKSVTLPNSIISIGDYAFYSCTGIEDISIPENVIEIGDQAFFECSSLTSIFLPDGLKTVGSFAFGKCSSLTELTIPDTVTSFEGGIQECSSLTSFSVPDCVNEISMNFFYQCTNLESVTIPDNVTSIGMNAFNGCENLKSIIIPNNVTSIDSGAFSNCKALTTIEIPSGVVSIPRYCFQNCINLKEIILSENVESIYGDAFSQCSAIESLSFPRNATILGSIDLFGCSNLKEFIVPDGSTIASFRGCSSLKKITIPESVTTIPDYCFYNCSVLDNVVIPDSVKSIGNYAFRYCKGLTTITIPGSVTSINTTAFYDDNNLRTCYTVPGSYVSTHKPTYNSTNSVTQIVYLCNEVYMESTDHLGFIANTVFMNSNSTISISDYLVTGFNINDCVVSLSNTGDFVYDDGMVASLAAGECTVTVSKGDYSASTTIIASDDVSETITSIHFSEDTISLLKGDSSSNTINILPRNANIKDVKWTSSNENIATVENGKITGIGPGTTTIRAYANNDSNVYDEFEVTVTVPLYDICILEDDIKLEKGNTKKLSFFKYPSDATNVTFDYSSSDTNVVSIEDSGMMTAVNAGTADIIVSSGTISKTVHLTVIIPLKGLSLDQSNVRAKCGDTIQLIPVFEPADTTEKDVVWLSSKDSVATVDNNGLVTVHSKGIATITATVGDYSATCSVVCNAHSWDEGVITTKPTCTETGIKTFTCSCGEIYTEEVEATGHQWNEDYTVDQEATCINEGRQSRHCANCNEVTDVIEIAALGHDYHEMEGSAVAPTCTAAGKEADQKCSRCDSIIEGTTINALGHTEEIIVSIAPTCTETGLTEGKKCSVCGETLVAQEVVPALGHDYVETVTAPTCEEQGYTTHTCSRCGDSYVDSYVTALGHEWGEWTVVKEATETEEGLERRVCKNDPTHIEERAIPVISHVHVLVKTDAVAATCTEDGNIVYWTCSGCGKYFSDAEGLTEITLEDTVVKASGHKEVIIPAVEPTCTETGLTEGKKCSACGETLLAQEVVPALGHDYISTVTAPTCETQGYTTHTCSRCQDSYTDSYVDALGHSWGEWTVVKEATETEEGLERRVCANDPTHIEERAIEKLEPVEPVKTGWVKEDGVWYYYKDDGTAATGWQKISGKWYYMDSTGAMQTGWKKIGSKWYYFNSSGVMQTGWKKIGSKQYFFKSSGAMAANEWVKGYYWINKDGTWTYKYKASWKKSGSKWWFGDTSGWYAKNTTITIDGKKYTFDKKGYMV